MDIPVVVQLQVQRGIYECVICKQQDLPCKRFISPRSLKRHVFSTHQYSKNFTVKCGIGGCGVTTNKLRFLNKHLREEHNSADWTPDYATVYNHQTEGDDLNLQELDVNHRLRAGSRDEQTIPTSSNHVTECSLEPVCEQYLNPEHTQDNGEDCDDEDDEISLFKEESEKSNCERRKQICLSLARLRSQNTMTEVCFESVKDWAAGLLTNLARVMVGGMKQHLSPEEIGRVDDVIEFSHGLSNPFHGLSEYNFLKVLHDDLGYVNPETVVLAEMPTCRGSERRTMQYIPVLGVLKMLLEDKNVVKQLCADRAETGYIQDFCDGEYFKHHPMFKNGRGSLQIQLYYDDFEVANPLGTKACIHKIGALYYTFLNLDPNVRFRFENIFLLALFTVEDLKNPDIGWKKILHRFNEELHLLENGTHNSAFIDGHPVTGTVTQLSADNLAAHSLLGLDQKFSGDNVHVSAYCLCTGLDIQEKFHEKKCILRTRQNYNDDLRSALETGQSSNGVKEACPLKSGFFHPAESHAPDAHHDVLEGVVPQTLKPILQTFIRGKRYFTLQTLNGRLASFDYNDQDSKNRPSPIKETKLMDDSRNLKQYASQYWCLLRKLPLILGDLVPEEDEHWCLLLCLTGMVDIILSPVIRTDVLAYLQTEICLFLREYKRLFPELRVTPKMHYLLHYPRLIKEFGPLSHHWVMRYEGKHKILKKTMDMTGNFINSAYTMAKRHQMQQIVSFHDRCTKNVVQVRRGCTVNVSDLEYGQMLAQAGVPNQVIMADHIKVFGTVYRKGNVVWIGWDTNGFEEFGEVLQILVHRDVMDLEKVHFVVECLQKLGFHEHFHSWEVCRTTPLAVKAVALIDLVDYNVVGKHRLFERGQEHKTFLNCKYRIDPLLEKP